LERTLSLGRDDQSAGFSDADRPEGTGTDLKLARSSDEGSGAMQSGKI
jgi:hypothetical protein